MWTVLPLIAPWRGDTRRNPAPYYIGKGMGASEYLYAVYVKRRLENIGLQCYVDLIELKG